MKNEKKEVEVAKTVKEEGENEEIEEIEDRETLVMKQQVTLMISTHYVSYHNNRRHPAT